MDVADDELADDRRVRKCRRHEHDQTRTAPQLLRRATATTVTASTMAPMAAQSQFVVR